MSINKEIREWLNESVAKQNIELATERDLWKSEAERLGSGYDSLKAENESLRKDAERYQFLMLSFVGDEGSPPDGYYVIYEDGCGFGEILCGDEATREIDAAMAQGEQS